MICAVHGNYALLNRYVVLFTGFRRDNNKLNISSFTVGNAVFLG
jgi:hypothetical protein